MDEIQEWAEGQVDRAPAPSAVRAAKIASAISGNDHTIGQPLDVDTADPTVVAAVAREIELATPEGDCLINRRNYRGGQPMTKVYGRLLSTRRLVYAVMVRPVAKDEKVTSVCDNSPWCVNPNHLAVYEVEFRGRRAGQAS